MNRLVVILAFVCLVTGYWVLAAPGQPASDSLKVDDVRQLIRELRPFTVTTGQAESGFQVLYVIDHESRQLSVLKYDDNTEALTQLAVRDLAKDFSAKAGGPYAMTTLQINANRGLLYVTDNTSRRILGYKVDRANQTVVPLTPIDLPK